MQNPQSMNYKYSFTDSTTYVHLSPRGFLVYRNQLVLLYECRPDSIQCQSTVQIAVVLRLNYFSSFPIRSTWDMNHRPDWEAAEVVGSEPHYWTRRVLEAIWNQKTPHNCNLDCGRDTEWNLVCIHTVKPTLSAVSYR